MPGGNPLVSVAEVRKQFRTVTAVDDVSLEIAEGEIFALLGPNGAGKSTLMRMLLGLVEPDHGVIAYRWNGGAARILPPERIGYLPEDRGLYPDVPVFRTLVHFGALRGMARADAAAAATHWLDVMGLDGRAGEQLKALSKGNQQKVQFISAIMHAPSFAVLDEPFSGLDPVNQDTFLDLIRQLRAAGTTVLLSAHQMSLVERVADRVAVMKNGRVILSGTLPELRKEWTAGSRLVLQLGRDADPAAAIDTAAGARVHVTSPRTVEVFVPDGTSFSTVLADLAARFDIAAIESHAVTLHDVYVKAIAA